MENPLVSIVVITYNSSKYVLETLESAKAQTYQNIELIISDDCSTDGTVNLCQNWLTQNKSRFVRTELLYSEVNNGISNNCNIGLNKAKGVWVKFIAGDDALESNIIDEYVKYVNAHKYVNVLYSNVKQYMSTFDEQNAFPIKDFKSIEFNNSEISAQSQFEILLYNNCVWAATLFFNREVLIAVGAFNELYPFFEDRPVLLSLTKNSYKIFYLDIIGAKYRKHENSIQTNTMGVYLSKFREDNQRFFINEYLSHYPICLQKEMVLKYKKNLFIKKAFQNKRNFVVKSISFISDLFIVVYVKLRY